MSYHGIFLTHVSHVNSDCNIKLKNMHAHMCKLSDDLYHHQNYVDTYI